MKIFDKTNEITREIEFYPEFTNNTLSTEQLIVECNNGRGETGIVYNEDAERWEADSESIDWWAKVCNGKQRAYDKVVNLLGRGGDWEDDSAIFDDFLNWAEKSGYVSNCDYETYRNLDECVEEYAEEQE